MSAPIFNVIQFPLPAYAGGGHCTITVMRSKIPAHVDFEISSAWINRTFSIPTEQAKAFALAIADAGQEPGNP